MKRTDFSYHLPPDLIAQEPRERGRSRMVVVTPPDLIEHDWFANFPARLAPQDVVVINDTRVIPARLFARKRALRSGRSRAARPWLMRRCRRLGRPVSKRCYRRSPRSGPVGHGQPHSRIAFRRKVDGLFVGFTLDQHSDVLF